jgi:hypothetical protein
MSLVARKRSKPTVAPDWKIVFEEASALKSVVDAASTMGKLVSFNVVKTPDGVYLLTVNAADAAYLCVLKAKLRIATPTFRSSEYESFSFCVECQHVLAAIDNPACAHLTTTMESYGETAKIVLKMFEPETHAHEVVTELPTFEENDEVTLNDMPYSMNVELEVQVIRELIKKSRKAHAEHISFNVESRARGAKKISIVQLAIDGNFRQEQTFCNEIVTDPDGSLIARAVQSEGTHKLSDVGAAGDDENAFEGVYPIEKIDAFLKNLPCRMITVRVKTGQPLLFVHRLGCDEISNIHYLVAPKNTDDDYE